MRVLTRPTSMHTTQPAARQTSTNIRRRLPHAVPRAGPLPPPPPSQSPQVQPAHAPPPTWVIVRVPIPGTAAADPAVVVATPISLIPAAFLPLRRVLLIGTPQALDQALALLQSPVEQLGLSFLQNSASGLQRVVQRVGRSFAGTLMRLDLEDNEDNILGVSAPFCYPADLFQPLHFCTRMRDFRLHMHQLARADVTDAQLWALAWAWPALERCTLLWGERAFDEDAEQDGMDKVYDPDGLSVNGVAAFPRLCPRVRWFEISYYSPEPGLDTERNSFFSLGEQEQEQEQERVEWSVREQEALGDHRPPLVLHLGFCPPEDSNLRGFITDLHLAWMWAGTMDLGPVEGYAGWTEEVKERFEFMREELVMLEAETAELSTP